ncbi:MAG TPA: large conductance mechanosensitive channel protein MscL [Pseudonocardiaceae bacterium]|nr:large conductance mechanosensitive channel protein MscL [Pseudonocardiaceae bacterium]
MLKGFRDYILRGNVLDLAVAVVIGVAFAAVVTAFVADILTPFIAAIGGTPDFGNLSFTIHNSRFAYGHFLNAVISFLFIAAAIYFFVITPVNALIERRKRGEEPEVAVTPEDIALLEEIRDILRSQTRR